MEVSFVHLLFLAKYFWRSGKFCDFESVICLKFYLLASPVKEYHKKCQRGLLLLYWG